MSLVYSLSRFWSYRVLTIPVNIRPNERFALILPHQIQKYKAVKSSNNLRQTLEKRGELLYNISLMKRNEEQE